jgi:hypothetical protein
VFRVRARELAPDNDLGDRLVTQGVGDLTAQEIGAALDSGEAFARTLLREGLMRAAALHLRGETRIVGLPLQANTVENPAGDRSLIDA